MFPMFNTQSRRIISGTSILVLLPLLVGQCGCRRATTSQEESAAGVVAAQQYREELVTYAIDNLNRLEDFIGGEMLQQIVARLDPQQQSAENQQRLDPLADCWPLPEMLRQVIERLNQWLRAQPVAANWHPDSLIDDLPPELREIPQLKELDRMELSRFEGFVLQEATWLRDISQAACGDLLDEVSRAESLFDWTMRNIQLEADSPERIPQFPWETLLLGHGTAEERAEVFLLLLGQLHIEAALLAAGKRPWCVGVLADGEVYLFEPRLGLPIPAEGGLSFRAERGLNVRPATLAQLQVDEKILKQLNLDTNNQYDVKKEDVSHLTVFILATPSSLSRRMEMIQSRLVGPQRMVLVSRPSEQAEQWRNAIKGAAVRLWPRPFEALQRRSALEPKQVQARLASLVPFFLGRNAPLYHGRILHLKGRLVGEEGAMQYYQAARPSHAELAASSLEAIEKALLLRGKQDASYWCGLLTFQRGNYSAAIDYFTRRTLRAYPAGPWTHGATYNLARAYEALGEIDRAVAQYQGDDTAPDYYGRLLRAKWLLEAVRRAQ